MMLEKLKAWLKGHRILFFIAKSIKRPFDFLYTIGSTSFLATHCRAFTQNVYIRNALIWITSPFSAIRYLLTFDWTKRTGLAFVAIAKNEAPYIEEWINFHVKQGVSHFFIYDNESTDNLHDVLKPYIRSGIVTYHKIRGIGRQMDAYNIAFSRYKKRFKYMGCIDCDEFVFVRKPLGGGGTIVYINSSMNLCLNTRTQAA